MGTYLFEVQITAAGSAAAGEKLGSGFDASLRDLVGQLGGTVVVLYFALGETDAFLIAEMPSDVVAAALAATVAASTHATVCTVALFEPGEIDIVLQGKWTWRPPGT